MRSPLHVTVHIFDNQILRKAGLQPSLSIPEAAGETVAEEQAGCAKTHMAWVDCVERRDGTVEVLLGPLLYTELVL